MSRWELGYAVPFGLHLRILIQLERQLDSPSFRATLADPRADDPMFLLYRLLKPVYAGRNSDPFLRELFPKSNRVTKSKRRESIQKSF
jgi:hypothetical protein